jgi:hypothetical protein
MDATNHLISLISTRSQPKTKVMLVAALLAISFGMVGCGSQAGLSPIIPVAGKTPAPENPTIVPATLATNPLPGFLFNNTVEWQQPSIAAGFGPTQPYTPVAHFGNSTYYIWIDSAFRAWVTQITNGTATVVPLDTGADYLVQPDGHHRFSLGVDSSGYIHVTGDMHHYSDLTTAVINPYPARYQNQTILYWKSNQPQSVTGGFSFAGGKGSATALPGSGWMMGRFFTDNNGVLYYSSMVHAYESPSVSNRGQMAVGLYRYDVGTKTWTAIGGLADTPTDPYLSHVTKVFYWENSGMSGGWFQNYQARFQFDSQNHLHFGVSGNTVATYAGADRLFYAFSPDGGSTWKRANGALIPALPLRGVDTSANRGDLVADSGAAAKFQPTVGLAIDKNGNPAISSFMSGQYSANWWVWNGSTWSSNTLLNTQHPFLAPSFGYRLPTNDLFLTNESPGLISRVDSFETRPYAYEYSSYSNSVYTPDETTLRNTGVLYSLMDAQPAPAILKTTFTNSSLPTDWADLDIGTRANAYSTSAAYANGIFSLYDFATGLGQTDDFHFTYLPMNCDGTVTVRVTQTSVGVPASPRAGIMLRESVEVGSKFVATSASLGNGTFSFLYRDTVGNWPVTTSQTGALGPYYLKLQRAGNVFTSSISPDGKTWQQLGQATLALSPALAAGLYSYADQHGYYMQDAKFDNVTVSSACTVYPKPIPTPSPSPSPTPSPSPSPTGGLLGQYFLNKTLSGSPVLTRIDPTLNFDWNQQSPSPLIPREGYSVLWTGRVQAKYSETYSFCLSSDDGARMVINGQVLVSNWTDHSVTENCGSIQMQANMRYQIKVQFYQNTGGATLKLTWSSPSQTKVTVPSSSLSQLQTK